MDKIKQRAERLVISCVMSEPSTLHEIMGSVTHDMFDDAVCKVIFKSIVNLYSSQQVINLITVHQDLKKSTSLYAKKAMGESSVIYSEFDYVEKQNLRSAIVLLMAENIRHEHIDLSEKIMELSNSSSYDPKEVLDIIQKHIAENKFKAMLNKGDYSNEELLKKLDEKIAEASFSDGVSGIRTGYRRFDYITSGMQPTNLIIVAARPAMGKELKNDSLVYTPIGSKRIGDINVGDEVLGSDGKHYNVIGVFPQGKKDVYRISFDDGSHVDAGLEHQWEVSTRHTRKNNKDAIVITTRDMIGNVFLSDRRKNYSIRLCKPLNFKEQQLEIHPYIMGALLGDGGLNESTIKFSNTEHDVVNRIRFLLPENHKLYLYGGCTYGLIGLNNENLVLKELKKLNIHRKRSDEKFIPKSYLYNSVSNRIQLLRGLIDTDGYVVKNNAIEYSTTSYDMCLDILELVRGLGGKASYKKRKGHYRKQGLKIQTKDYYRMYLSLPEDIIPVSSKKHLARYKPSKKFHCKFIKSIEKMDHQEEMTCISVDAPDCLYVTDGYTLTHNTQFALGIMKTASINNDKKGLFVSCEMDEVQVMKRIIAMQGDIPGYSIKKGQLSNQESERYRVAKAQISKSNIKIIAGSFTITEILSIIYKMKYSEGLDYVVIDYIQKISAPGAQNRTNEVGEVSRRLKDIANELKIPIVALAQLSRAVEHRTDKKPVLSDLRESGDIEQDADIVAFLYRQGYYMSPEERENNEMADDGYVVIAKHRDGDLEDIYLKFDSDIPAWKNPNDKTISEFSTEPLNSFLPNKDFDEEIKNFWYEND